MAFNGWRTQGGSQVEEGQARDDKGELPKATQARPA